MTLPKAHQTIMPYLMIKGALEFIDFTRKVFDAELTADMHQLHEDQRTVLHSEVVIGGSTIMFTDATDEWPVQTANMFVYVDNADQRFKKAIDSGATVLMDLSDKSYGRTCGVKDPFGNSWWITSLKN
jgi:PhnB protein